MSHANEISCPKCGSADVTCSEDPHNHQCHACGYSMLPQPQAEDTQRALDVALLALALVCGDDAARILDIASAQLDAIGAQQ